MYDMYVVRMICITENKYSYDARMIRIDVMCDMYDIYMQEF